MDVNALENLLDTSLPIRFAHSGLCSSIFQQSFGGCYQRLEFLGDAVLDYLITSYLYSVYPNLKPGQLTDLRSVSVNNTSFADVAGRWSFHKFIICDSSVLRETMTKYVNNIGSSATAKGQIEEKLAQRGINSCISNCVYMNKVLCTITVHALGDLVESCMGAVFLDTGFDLNHVWKIMLSLLDPIISFSKLQMNPLRNFMNSANPITGSHHVSGKVARRMAAKQVSECLKAQGYKSKTKSLEEVLRKSASPTVSAKSHLYEICAANCWKPPLFECWKETGPSHIKEYILRLRILLDLDSP
ncbi:UNVERIFIED_CONTAM: Dicer-like protein 4 [Sesamum latifolium]|uniref:Dicer-like protein 4 n=1 Tax=Sesamum latifolium TaxID=2727402 RepID=A0AAW2YAF8_9LAMI